MKAIRSFATPLTIFSSLVVLGTGLWMFFASKSHTIEEIHSKVGLLFVVGVGLHLVVNSRPLFNQLGRKATYWMVLPVALISGWMLVGEGGLEGKSVPPGAVFHRLEGAELGALAKVMGSSEDAVVASMRNDGLAVAGAKETLRAVAEANKKEPWALLHYFMGPGRE